MGSGKTTIGKQLAKNLNLQFVDLDLFIENRYRKSISTIFKEKGEEGFREIERKALQEVAGFEDVIISTGGGLPCFFNNIHLMNQTGTTIYLKVSVEELTKRLNVCKHNRPLISDKTLEELKDFIELNLNKREEFYNKASLVFDAEGLTTKEDINTIVNRLASYLTKETIV